MGKRRITFYEILVYVAYGYFLLVGLAWFFMSFSEGFNYTAFIMALVFGVQAYFKHRLTNLVIGILIFGLSIFMLLQSIDLSRIYGFSPTVNIVLASSIISILLSLVLIFSYTKLKYLEEERGNA
jgi:hypothetical protein